MFFAQEPAANHVTNGLNNSSNSTWIMYSGESHHVTRDLLNLSIYSDYDDGDELLVGNGTGLSILNTG